MKPLVSIIVPAHNAEAYLPECLASLRRQTLKEIEILLIDDGSKDQTASIARQAAARDPRLRLITLSHNQGVSAARNAGLDAAQGDFIGFCDADDLAAPDMYQKLYQAAAARQAEVAFCAVQKKQGDRLLYTPLPWPDGTCFDRAAIRGALLPQIIARPEEDEGLPVSGYTPRNLFARQVLCGLRFREDLHYAEDLLLIVQALLRAERAVMLSEGLYTYRFHGASKTKRYVPGLGAQTQACHRALTQAFTQNGMGASMEERMQRRARRAALALAINLCLPGSPYGLAERVCRVRALARDPQTKVLFQSLRLSQLPFKLRLKYGCMKGGWALPLVLYYSFLYRG